MTAALRLALLCWPPMAAKDTSRISPTAHYTGYVWYRNGLGHPGLETRAGRILFHALEPAMRVFRLLGAPALEDMLMARHQALELLLCQAIDSGRIGQVVEIAAGLSPRGYRMSRRFASRGLVYVEGDLADMTATKRRLLAEMGDIRPNHHVVELDALDDIGPRSVFDIGQRYLDPNVGTAVITEGLVNYFSRAMVTGMWARIARFLAQFPEGLYASDLHVIADLADIPGIRAFTTALSAFTRGFVHIHFDDARAATAALMAAGFDQARCLRPADLGHDLPGTGSQSKAPVHIVHALMGRDDR